MSCLLCFSVFTPRLVSYAAIYLNGGLYAVSGTSCSTPVFAGMVTLVNAMRLQQGRSPLGWINPAIYSSGGQFANDITTGDNKCTHSSSICCSQGFSAAAGWDPVTGSDLWTSPSSQEAVLVLP